MYVMWDRCVHGERCSAGYSIKLRSAGWHWTQRSQRSLKAGCAGLKREQSDKRIGAQAKRSGRALSAMCTLPAAFVVRRR
jgi:hypothetical protein